MHTCMVCVDKGHEYYPSTPSQYRLSDFICPSGQSV